MTVADLAIIAALVFAWGTLSARLESFDMTAPIVFTVAGVLLTHGPLAPLGITPSREVVKVLAAGRPGTRVTGGSWPLAQPFRIGPGLIRARFHTSGQGLGEHERGGGLEFAAQQAGGAGRLAQGPPVLARSADLGEFHLAPRLLAQPRGGRDDLPAGQ